ncbi:MAG TPA: hypothetical protein VNT26_10030 [Candidatus Sulfotelmatobacter sp.]|nr:hypothetical protein [Candidatus Sulfotelmatobacter sp.]HWI56744.1 hypothetical protein [Bacillota bacterium]
MRTGVSFESDVEPLREQLDTWRAIRPGRQRIPEPLWQAAAELARRHGVHPVARALHLDYYRLQDRVPARNSKPITRPAAPAFVEVPWSIPAPAWECTAHLEDRRGAKLHLRLVGGGAAEVAALAQSFWQRQP